MSENVLRLIAPAPGWMPAAAAADRAEATVRMVFPDAREVRAAWYDDVAFIDTEATVHKTGCRFRSVIMLKPVRIAGWA